jgi:hypothetical protein
MWTGGSRSVRRGFDPIPWLVDWARASLAFFPLLVFWGSSPFRIAHAVPSVGAGIYPLAGWAPHGCRLWAVALG